MGSLSEAIAAAKANSPAKAAQNANARSVLERLESAGDLSPIEAATLAALRGSAASDQDVLGSTAATYRGAAKGATFNLRDEIAGVFGGSQARDAVRAKDAAAQAAYPDEFGRGEFAGAVGTSMLPAGGFTVGTKGLGLLGKMGIGGVMGGAVEGARGFAGGEGGFLPRIEEAKEPAAWGAGFGAAAPLVGKAAGAGVRAIANRSRKIGSVPARAVKPLRQSVQSSQAAVGDINQYLKSLGPDAMLADVPGGLQSQAQGLAAAGGEGGALLAQRVNQRAKGAGARIKNVLDAEIEGPNAAFLERRDLAATRSNVLGPEYEAALAMPDPLDVSSVKRGLDDAIDSAGPKTRGKLESLRSGIAAKDGMPALKLHNLRSDLSDDIAEATRAGRTKEVQAMTSHLRAIDKVLDDVPGYKDARSGYANNMAMERAIEDGEKALRGSRMTALSPKEFEAEFGRLSDAQKDAFRTGVRRDVAALMGTSRNEAASAWGEFSKEWNVEKLNTVLGADAAAPIIKRMNAEKAFSETRGKVTAGSQTDFRRAAREQLQGADPKPATGASLLTLGASDRIKEALDFAVGSPRRGAANKALGEALSASGPEAEKLLRELLRQASTQRGEVPARLVDNIIRALTTTGGTAVNTAP